MFKEKRLSFGVQSFCFREEGEKSFVGPNNSLKILHTMDHSETYGLISLLSSTKVMY